MRYPSLVTADFDRFFDSFWREPRSWAGPQLPVDVSESEAAFHLSFDIPGVKKEDLHIEVKGNHLVISGERRREVHEKRQGREIQERVFGRFERSFSLPETVDGDRVEARFENGVLDVSIPKREEEKPKRIEIQ